MTTPVCVRQRIRQLDRQGLSHKEISRRLGVSRTTVVRYANHGDYSPRPSNAVLPGRSLVDRGVFGRRGRVAGRGSAHARQATPYRDARVRAARGRARVHGLVLVGAALDQALEAGASSAVGRFRRVGVGAGQRAGRFRPGQGRGRRSRTRGAFPGGVVPVFEHALGGRPSRRDLGVRVPGFAVDLRAHGHGAWGGGVRQRRRRGPSQAGRHGRPDPLVLPVLRALRVRIPVPRPVFRPREGQCGERGRLSSGAT